MSCAVVVPALRRFLLVCCTLVACRPSGSSPDLKEAGDPSPPQARVIATLTDHGAVQGDPRKGSDTDPPGAVLGVEPIAHASITEPILVEFATAMEPSRSRVEIVLEPFVPGEITWTSPTRAVFVPQQALRSATEYAVQASGVAYTRGGAPVQVERRWTFETPRPTASLEPSHPAYGHGTKNEMVGWKAQFSLFTSEHVTRQAVRDAITVTSEDGGTALPYRLIRSDGEARSDPTDAWSIGPRGHWPPGAKVRATVAPSLVSLAGPLPTGAEVFATMKVRPGLSAVVDCQDEAKDGCVVGGLDIDFDESVPRSVIRQISVSPEPKAFEVRPWVYSQDDRTLRSISLYGNFEPDETYTVRFRGRVQDVKGQSLVGPRTRTIRFVPPPPALDLSVSGTLLSSDTGTFGVETRSLEDATLVISTLSNAALAEAVYPLAADRRRPRTGAKTREVQLDLHPGGTWGWDARALDLSKELGAPRGAAFFEAFPGTVVSAQAARADLEPRRALVQLTNLGVTVGVSPAGSFVRVLALDDATPVSGATAHVYDTTGSPAKHTDTLGPSDADGFIRVPRDVAMTGALVVETRDDRVALSLRGEGEGHWRFSGEHGTGQAYDVGVVMADRGIYQPGERMRVMGWIARSSTAHPSGVEGSGTHPVRVELKDGQNRVIATSSVRSKAYGKFWATLEVPDSVALGGALVEATLERDGEQASFSTYVMLREFTAPAFDVSLSLQRDQLLHGEPPTGRAVARYLHGMAVPIESADLSSRCSPSYYVPPTDGEFDVARPPVWPQSVQSESTQLESTPTFRDGLLSFEATLPELRAGSAYKCSINVMVRDVARQALRTTASAQVHPSGYLLISNEELNARVGSERTIVAKALRFDGASTSATGTEIRITHEKEDGTTGLHTCPLRFDSDGVARCRWTPTTSGRHVIALTGDVDGVKVRSEQSTYVAAKRRSDHHSFVVDVPKNAEAGTPIEVSIHTAAPSATGVVVAAHAGIRSLHPFAAIDHQAAVPLTPDDRWVPRGYVDTLVAYPKLKDRLPEFDSSYAKVELGYATRALKVAVESPDSASSGTAIPIDVAVTDPSGDPVEGAHVSVWAVDEGILMLREWSFPDFARQLASDRGSEARYFHSYGDLRWPYSLRSDPFEPRDGTIGLGNVGTIGRGSGAGFGGGSGKVGSASARPNVRRDFDPAPIFIGDVETGSDGTARVRGMLPDNLTTFRIAAVATAELAGTGAFVRAGRAEGQVRVTQDLAVRPVLPRVLRPGDTAQLGLLVDNLAGRPGILELAVELEDAQGVLKLTSPAKIRRPLEDAQVRVPVEVQALAPGEVRIRVFAKLVAEDGSVLQDASELPLEVKAERTMTRHAATYGSFTEDDAAAIALDVPQGHTVGSAHASVDVFASLLGGYRGAVDTIVQYPYGCVEQTSSRLVPLAALHGLGEYDLGVEDVETFAKMGVERLASMKTDSGGLAYWPGSAVPHPYATAYAVWVLSELERAGVDVPGDLITGAGDYLRQELGRLRALGTPNTHEDVRAAMALLALSSRGKRADDVLDELLGRQDTLPTFSKSMLLMTLHALGERGPRYEALLQSIRDRIVVRGETARVKAESTLFTRFFDSPVRTDAMVLLALVRTAPDEPLIEPLARGLTAARDAGQIRNTQESAYALLAMAGYASLREAVTPDLDVRAWVGPNMVVETQFEGRDLSLRRGEGPITGGSPLVTLQRLGAGRLYYRVGMQWAPRPDTIEAQARGLALTRTFHDARGALDGGRSMVAGEAGVLEFEITADARQRYVVVDVPLPAGIEAVDRSLGRGGSVPHVSGSHSGASLPYSRQEIRGDRVVVFVDHLPAGTYLHRVPIRATHEGDYTVPPAVAEAMYAPEFAGNTESSTLRIVSP